MRTENLIETCTIIHYEIKDGDFQKLIDTVLKRIPDEYEDSFPSFSIFDGVTKFGASVDEDVVTFDTNLLKKEPVDVKMGIIAHELAHVFLKHAYIKYPTIKEEKEADELACKWGFTEEINSMRRKFEPKLLETARTKKMKA